MKRFTLSPSDFAWLYDVCPRCWWLKAHARTRAGVRDGMPSVFNNIDRAMKQAVTVEVLNAAGIPAASIDTSGEWLKSVPYEHAGVSVVIAGKRDVSFTMENGLAGIVDYKTTRPAPATILKYSRQLHGYMWAMQWPERGQGREVGYLGLYCFEPYQGRFDIKHPHAAMCGSVCALPVEIDCAAFEKYLDKACEILAGPMPSSTEECPDCWAMNTVADTILKNRVLVDSVKEGAA